jgi:hypothetical protein
MHAGIMDSSHSLLKRSERKLPASPDLEARSPLDFPANPQHPRCQERSLRLFKLETTQQNGAARGESRQ